MSGPRAFSRKRARATRRILGTLSRAGGTRSIPRGHHGPHPTDPFLDPIGPLVPSDPPGATVVLLNDTRDQRNYGANALVDGLLPILSQSMPNATILPIPSHWLRSPSDDLGDIDGRGTTVRYRLATFPTVADQFEMVADEWMTGRGGPAAADFLNLFDRADMILLNGEGSIYRTNQTAIRELFLAWFAKARLGKPTVYLNGGVHLTDVVPILPAMVRKTFGSLDAVAVREPCSLRNLQEHAPDVEAHLFPDAAFSITANEARASASVESVLAQVGDAPYFCFDPGAMPMDARGGKGSALFQLTTALQRIVPRAVFVASAPADRYIEEVAQATGALFTNAIADYREFMALVSGAQFLVSGRYHNVILAGIMGCPSIAFASTTHKVHGACEMLDGVVGTPYDGTYLRPDLEAITQRARAYVDDRATLGIRLRDVCERRRFEVAGLGELVNGVLRSRE